MLSYIYFYSISFILLPLFFTPSASPTPAPQLLYNITCDTVSALILRNNEAFTEHRLATHIDAAIIASLSDVRPPMLYLEATLSSYAALHPDSTKYCKRHTDGFGIGAVLTEST